LAGCSSGALITRGVHCNEGTEPAEIKIKTSLKIGIVVVEIELRIASKTEMGEIGAPKVPRKIFVTEGTYARDRLRRSVAQEC